VTAPADGCAIATARTVVRPIETTVDIMYSPAVNPVSMLPERTPRPETFRDAERAMTQLAVLGMLIGVASVLTGALAAFMLLGA
jgi:hypothetical protein